jgi:hypothetical protein
MKAFWQWIVKNLSNIFGFLGIAITIFIGFFYVPNWLKNVQFEKTISAQRDLEQSIKELIYSDSICDYSEIVTLMRANELQFDRPNLFSTKDLLTLVQESFMQDRFIPLEKRRKLISELESLKKQIPAIQENKTNTNESKGHFKFLQWLSILVTTLGVIGGILSFYFKFRTEKEKDEEIENQSIETNNEIKSQFNVESYYKHQIAQVIGNHPGVIVSKSLTGDFGFDIEFEYNGKINYVLIKYLSETKVGLNSIKRLFLYQKGLEGNFWFIYNTDITELVKRQVQEMNKITREYRETILLKAENGTEFKREFEKILMPSN